MKIAFYAPRGLTPAAAAATAWAGEAAAYDSLWVLAALTARFGDRVDSIGRFAPYDVDLTQLA